MLTLIKNIKELVQVESGQHKLRAQGKEMAQMETIKNAYLIVEDDKIKDFGTMETESGKRKAESEADIVVDATGRMVFPTFCDTHLVYANSRELEFVDKIRGLSYEEIAKRGGGILNSAKATAAASEDELYELAQQRLDEAMRLGTGAIEIKSGYGLSTESELKLLRVIRRLRENSPLTIRSNFLGAHGIPMEYRGHQEDYVDLVINEMLPRVAAEGLADFIDVFCDQGFFTVDDTARILEAGIKYGLRPKIHANEMAISGGVQVGVKYNAISVDHLEQMGDAEIECLKGSDTMPTILPGCLLPQPAPLAGPPYDRSRPARGNGIGLQPRHFALVQYAARPIDGLHPLPPDPRRGPQRHHPQHRLRYGRQRPAGHHSRRQACQLLHHQAYIESRIYALLLRRKQSGVGLFERKTEISELSGKKAVYLGSKDDVVLYKKSFNKQSLYSRLTALNEIKSEKVGMNVIGTGTGNVSMTDVKSAAAGKAIIVGFNIGNDSGVQGQARHDGVRISSFRIIYELLDHVRNSMLDLLPPEFKEVVLGHAEIKAIYDIGHLGRIAGSQMLDGKLVAKEEFRILRASKPIWSGRVQTLRHFKDEVKEITGQQECGVCFAGYEGFEVGDVIECYSHEELPKSL